MSTLIQRGQAMLNAAMGTAAGVSVAYTPKAGGSATLTPWVGRTAFRRNQTEQGPAVLWGDRDYLIPVAGFEAAFGAGAVPKVGDRITETVDGSPLVFELMPPDTGEPAWRYSDQTRTAFRLHVKKVSG